MMHGSSSTTPESLQSKNARAAIANWANANLALATKLFGQHNAKLSRPPRDFRFGDDGSISLNAITGHWTYQKYGGDLEEIDEIHNEIAEKSNRVGWPAVYAEYRRRYTIPPGLEDLPFERLGEGITLDDLYPPEECAALRAHGLTDDEILDLSPEQMHEILTGPVALARTLEEDTRPVTKGEPATNPTDPVEQTPDSKAAPTTDITALRLQLRKNDFDPIPVEDKGPRMKGWQLKFDVSEEEIRRWPKTYPRARKTGVIAKFTPGLDIDITIEAAGAHCRHPGDPMWHRRCFANAS